MTAQRCGVLLVVLAVGLVMTACSGPTVHISVPGGWKPVSYSGLTIDVPASWSVDQRQKKDCGIRGPGVLVGPPPTGTPICPSALIRGPVVTFGGPDTVSPVGRERSTIIHGVDALLSKKSVPELPQWGSEEVVRFPGRTTWLDISVPSDASSSTWVTINEVVATVRPST